MNADPAGIPLEPASSEIAAITGLVVNRLSEFMENLPQRPTVDQATLMAAPEVTGSLLAHPPEHGGELNTVLDKVFDAGRYAVETAGPGMMGGVPGGGLYTSAVAEFITRTLNRYGGFAAAAPGFTALEEGVLRWIAQEVCGLPQGSSGILTTGGSLANLAAVVTARHARLGETIEQGTIYVSSQTHYSIAKAARIAGLPARNIRVVPSNGQLQMDAAAARDMIAADRRKGLRPFMLVATAGSTDLGVIDPLPELGAVAGDAGLWFHADAAYGGFFRLTGRGKERLSGIERADSVTLDPHKTLFLPFGTGALVARDPSALAAAHEGTANVLAGLESSGSLPDYAAMGPELTRETRGLRIWLPLQLHGVAAFRQALEEKLDLAAHLYDRLSAMPGIELPWEPGLSTVAFRARPAGTGPVAIAHADAATRELISRINAGGQIHIRGTDIDGRHTVRICISSHRTHQAEVEQVLERLSAAIG